MRPGIGQIAAVLAGVIASPASARAESLSPELPETAFTWGGGVLLGAVPRTVSLSLQARLEIASGALLWGQVSAIQSAEVRDLDGDGQNDFAASDFGPYGEIEVGAGWRSSLRVVRRTVPAEGATLRIDRSGPGARQSWTQTVEERASRERHWIAAARVAVLGDELQVGLPIGLRTAWRWRTPDLHWGWIAQLRAALFVPAFRPGADAALSWQRGPIVVTLVFDYIPPQHTPEPGSLGCSTQRYCKPRVPLTTFDRVPDEATLLLGLRLGVELG